MSAPPPGGPPEAAARRPAAEDEAADEAALQPDWAGEARGGGAGLGGGGASTARPMRLQTARPWSGTRLAGDGALLGMIRKHMEAVEERVHGQLAHVREQQQHSRLREAALTRIEEKVTMSERAQPKMDRKVAELTGNFKGLSDEIQAQIRRQDQADERFHSWRRQLEEELRQRFAELEQRLQQATSGSRVLDASVQEGQRRLGQRLARLETDLAERLALQDEAHDGLESVWERLAALESQHMDCKATMDDALSRNGACGAAALCNGVGDEALAILERRLADVAGRAEGALQDAQEAHARVAQQEQQHKALRTLVEAREEHLREWDGKHGSMRQAEHLPASTPRLGSGGEACSDVQALDDCRERLQKTEARLGVLEVELDAARADADLAPRVANLVAQLRELVPRVVQHGRAIAELRGGDRAAGGEAQDLSDIAEQLKSHGKLIAEQAQRSEKAAEDASAARRDLERLTELSDSVKLMADGLVGDFDGLKQDIASLAASIPRREEILEITGQVKQHAVALAKKTDTTPVAAEEVSEVKQELADLVASSQATKESYNSLSRDFADLRNALQESIASSKDVVKHHAFQETLGSVQQDIDALKQRLQAHGVQEGPTKEDHATVTQRLDEHAELLAETARLTRQATTEAFEAKQSAERLAARLSADGAAGHLSDQQSDLASAPEAAPARRPGGAGELALLQLARAGAEQVPNTMDKTALLSALDTRLDALGSSACTNGDAEHQQHQDLQHQRQHQSLLMDTARRVWEDHENESKVHEKVLSCIDDLCTRLAALDSAVVTEGAQPSADLERRFEALASRVAEMQALERQLQLQVEGFAMEARLARGAAAPVPPVLPGQPAPDGAVSAELCKLADADAGGGCN